MTSLHDLPDELLRLICEYVQEHTALRDLGLVSRKYHAITLPYICKHVDTRRISVPQLINCLHKKPEVGQGIHTLDIGDWPALIDSQDQVNKICTDVLADRSTYGKHLSSYVKRETSTSRMLLRALLALTPNVEVINFHITPYNTFSYTTMCALASFITSFQFLEEVNVSHEEGGLEFSIELYCPLLNVAQALSKLTISNCVYAELEDLPRGSYPHLRELRLKCVKLYGLQLIWITRACSHLEIFEYGADHDAKFWMTPQQLVTALQPVKNSLKTLIVDLTAQDKLFQGIDPIKSLREFTQLEELVLSQGDIVDNTNIQVREEYPDLIRPFFVTMRDPVADKLPTSLRTLQVKNTDQTFDYELGKLAMVVESDLPHLKLIRIDHDFGEDAKVMFSFVGVFLQLL